DVSPALSHLRACLAEGGLLVFLELVTRDFVRDDIVFGLLKGWWRFTDTALRPHSALLDRRQWETVLTHSGFVDVRSVAYTHDGYEAEHAVMIGSNPSAVAPVTRLPAPANDARRYVVFADEDGIGDALAARLRALGHESVLIRHGRRCEQERDDSFR